MTRALGSKQTHLLETNAVNYLISDMAYQLDNPNKIQSDLDYTEMITSTIDKATYNKVSHIDTLMSHGHLNEALTYAKKDFADAYAKA